jgi:hypothetical protein
MDKDKVRLELKKKIGKQFVFIVFVVAFCFFYFTLFNWAKLPNRKSFKTAFRYPR